MQNMVYSYTMSDYKEHVTNKVWKGTLKKLRMVYALTGENMVSILDRLISEELEEIQQEQRRQNDANP